MLGQARIQSLRAPVMVIKRATTDRHDYIVIHCMQTTPVLNLRVWPLPSGGAPAGGGRVLALKT